MKKDIILCGVGGDGIVSVAKIISDAALNRNLYLKQSEIHGMSQRGGSVFSHLRISDKPIYADVIPEGQADIILSSEPMEALRYLPFLAADGCIITNSEPFVNIKNYPDMEKVMAELNKVKNTVAFNANDKISFVAKLGDGLYYESSKDKDVDAVSHFGLSTNTLAALEIGMYYNF
ncbi:MAG: indolepyruvate oxidoreductase subunit beta [Bacteroidales bacterium]|nr:indolepyruvate oxidoreductase subunit beta [Bacteroidales bacterium]